MINWKISWFVLGLNVWLTHSIVYVTLQSIFCYFNLCGWAKCWILIGLLIDVASNLITLIDENMETRANSFLFTQAWNYLAIHNEYSNAFWHQVALIGILLFSSLIADFVIRFRKNKRLMVAWKSKCEHGNGILFAWFWKNDSGEIDSV